MVSNAVKADVLLVVVTLLAAISWMFSKEAVLLMPPLLFVAMRFLLAGVMLAMAGYSQLQAMNWDQYRQSVMVGLVFGMAMSCWIMGLHFGTHIGEGAFLTSLGVVLVPVIVRLLFKEGSPVSTWLALPIAAFGLALLSLKDGFKIELGQVFYVSAAIIFALFYAMNTRAVNRRLISENNGEAVYSEKVPALALTAITLTCVGLLAAVLSLVLEPWQAGFEQFSLTLAAWILASAVIGTAARFFIQTYAQSLSTHSHGVVIMVAEPVWTASLAALWFCETMLPMQFVGCAFILIALLVNRWAVVWYLWKWMRLSGATKITE